ncbi:hypothetical protein Vretifemale_5269, partial [Volvox reticuliferus]
TVLATNYWSSTIAGSFWKKIPPPTCWLKVMQWKKRTHGRPPYQPKFGSGDLGRRVTSRYLWRDYCWCYAPRSESHIYFMQSNASSNDNPLTDRPGSVAIKQGSFRLPYKTTVLLPMTDDVDAATPAAAAAVSAAVLLLELFPFRLRIRRNRPGLESRSCCASGS